MAEHKQQYFEALQQARNYRWSSEPRLAVRLVREPDRTAEKEKARRYFKLPHVAVRTGKFAFAQLNEVAAGHALVLKDDIELFLIAPARSGGAGVMIKTEFFESAPGEERFRSEQINVNSSEFLRIERGEDSTTVSWTTAATFGQMAESLSLKDATSEDSGWAVFGQYDLESPHFKRFSSGAITLDECLGSSELLAAMIPTDDYDVVWRAHTGTTRAAESLSTIALVYKTQYGEADREVVRKLGSRSLQASLTRLEVGSRLWQA